MKGEKSTSGKEYNHSRGSVVPAKIGDKDSIVVVWLVLSVNNAVTCCKYTQRDIEAESLILDTAQV